MKEADLLRRHLFSILPVLPGAMFWTLLVLKLEVFIDWGDLLRRFPLFANVPLPPALMFCVCLEFPLILAAPSQEPLVLHSMLTIDPTAPPAFACFWEPMKEADLLRLLPELARVPLPPALIFWVCLEFPRILTAPLQDPLVLHSMLVIEPTAPPAFFCSCCPMKLGLQNKFQNYW